VISRIRCLSTISSRSGIYYIPDGCFYDERCSDTRIATTDAFNTRLKALSIKADFQSEIEKCCEKMRGKKGLPTPFAMQVAIQERISGRYIRLS